MIVQGFKCDMQLAQRIGSVTLTVVKNVTLFRYQIMTGQIHSHRSYGLGNSINPFSPATGLIRKSSFEWQPVEQNGNSENTRNFKRHALHLDGICGDLLTLMFYKTS